MLVLQRKKNEEITIGDDIRIMVVEIRGDNVRLGISAPKNVPVHRKEIHDMIAASIPVKKTVHGIETTFVSQDDDWDSSEGNQMMVNEGCPNTEDS